MLRSVWVARPEDEDERPVARLEQRQHNLGGDIDEVVLLRHIGDRGARGRRVAGFAVLAARRCDDRQTRRAERRLHVVGQRDTLVRAGRIIHDDCRRAGAVGVIKNQRRAELSDRAGADPDGTRRREKRHFVEIIPAKMLVDIAENRIAFEEGRKAFTSSRHRKTGIDRVAEVAGVAQIMAGCHRRGVRRRESREQRVRIVETDSLVADRCHRRRRVRGDHQRAKAIGYEEHHIVRLVGCRRG